MAYGTLKVDTITYDDGTGTDVDVQVSALAGAGSAAPLNDPDFTGTPTSPTPASSSNDTSIATTAFVNTAVGAGQSSWTNRSQSGTIDLGQYMVDTSGGAFSLELPWSGINTGDTVVFSDAAGTWNTNNLTLAINYNSGGHKIAGANGPLVCNVQYATVTLTWSGFASVGWLLK